MKNPSTDITPVRRRREIRRAAALALLAGTAFYTPAAVAADADPAEESKEEAPQPSEFKNWVEFSLGGTAIHGDEAAFRQRSGLPEGVFGGVSNFHYEQEVATNTVFRVDGRGIFDNRDYALRLELQKEEVGFLRAGVSEFRTYYDGSGGYLPGGNDWYQTVFNDELAVDRREYWFEAGLRLPKWPEFTVRYSRQEREGRKSSTHWGPVTTGAVNPDRNVVPAFLDLDEVRDLFAVDARKVVGKADLNLGLRYERQDLDNTKNLRLYPGEGVGVDSYGTQRDKTETDLFNVHGWVDTLLKNDLRFTVGYAYTDLDLSASGYRVFGNGYDPDLGDRLPNANTFQDLNADGTLRQHVAHLNLLWSVAKGLDVIPSLRMEKQDRDGASRYALPAAPLGGLPYGASSDRGLLDLSESLELRYSGLTNVVFYAKGDWLQGSGDLDETADNLATGASLVNRSSDDERSWQKYSLGANWYPIRRLSVSGGYYHKIRNNDFDHPRDNTSNTAPPPLGSRYPAYLIAQQYTVDDLNARVSWRPRNNVTLAARYDYQVGTLESQVDLLDEVESADMTSHVVSGSVSWVPLRRLYLQARASLVQDTTETAVSSLSAAVQDAENDYWTCLGTVGYAASDAVDLEASYFYYRADNFVENWADGVPYGAGAVEHGVSVGATWRLSPRVRWTTRYGFVTTDDETYYGQNDYDAHWVQTSVQYRF